MSRSRKKTPVTKDSPGKIKKRMANKRVRNRLKRDLEESLQYKTYRKTYPQYDLCDWWFYGGSFERYYRRIRRLFYEYPSHPMPTREELRKDWYKIYRRK